jgi:hypothetical protein
LTPNEVNVDTPKSRVERIQTLLISALGVILPYGVHSIMHRVFHSASDFIIFIAMMLVPLTLVILIERKKNHRHFITQ